jgi:FtsP/CotA-like multicopper oxidase with cupredoxin domain
VTKTFQIDGIQQFVYMDTGRGLQPATVTPGTPGTRLAWTVYDDARLMMPATPYLLSTYMTTHQNDSAVTSTSSNVRAMLKMAGMRPARRLEASSANDRPSPAAAPGSSKYITADTQHLTVERRYWDQYAIVTPRATPNTNIAIPTNGAAEFMGHNMKGQSSRPEAAGSASMLQPLRVEKDEVVDVVVQAYASGSGGCDLHPWHMHGHSFWLLARGSGLYNAETSYGLPDTLISANPLRVDTVSGYPSNYSESLGEVRSGRAVKGAWRDACGWFKIRFVADNPGTCGVWFL